MIDKIKAVFWFAVVVAVFVLSITAEVVGLITIWGWIWK